MTRHSLFGTIGFSVLFAGSVAGAQTHIGNVTIDGSLCVGFDCTVGMAFGFDTIILKENNLRIFFDDTSVAAAFPRNDWAFQANDSSNGGGSYMALVDRTTGRQVFRVDAAARTNALYVDSQGDLGLGTSTPATDIDIKVGDTPTVRLQQDGTSGFTPQTWDLAGNETNFFIRDATGGSTLPFRIRPGAPTSAIDVAGSGFVGIGTSAPEFQLDVLDNQALLLKLANTAGAVTLRMDANDDGTFWNLTSAANNNALNFARNGNATGTEMILSENGNLAITGTLTTGSSTVYPDYVFRAGYDLMPLPEVEKFIIANGHLPKIPTAAQVAETGLNISEMQVALLEKVEELTLYTLEQQKVIDLLLQERAARQ